MARKKRRNNINIDDIESGYNSINNINTIRI